MNLSRFTTLTLLLLVIIPQRSQARFQAISKAYDILRGKASSAGEPIEDIRKADPMRWSVRSRRPYFDDTASDERWKERVIMGAILLVCWYAGGDHVLI